MSSNQKAVDRDAGVAFAAILCVNLVVTLVSTWLDYDSRGCHGHGSTLYVAWLVAVIGTALTAGGLRKAGQRRMSQAVAACAGVAVASDACVSLLYSVACIPS